MLAIGLLLYSMRGLMQDRGWNTTLLKLSFWLTNAGLAIMFLFTLLPVGLLQVLDNIRYGFWHARRNDFWNDPFIQLIGNIRILPDTMIIAGAGCLLLFMVKAMAHLKSVTIKPGEVFTD